MCKLSFNDITSFFHFHFLIQDTRLILIISILFKLNKSVNNINREGTVSQILYLGLSFNFMLKNGKIYLLFFSLTFFSLNFLDLINQKVRPI